MLDRLSITGRFSRVFVIAEPTLLDFGVRQR